MSRIRACDLQVPSLPSEFAAPAPAPPSALPSLVPSIEEQAEYLARVDDASSVYLAISAGVLFGNRIPTGAFGAHLAKVRRDCGQSNDPIERMMIEQMVLAHHNIGRFHVKAAAAESTEEVEVYTAAAARLLAEFRRGFLAVRKCRELPGKRSFTVVKQQNVAQSQQVALIESSEPAQIEGLKERGSKKIGDSELGSKRVIGNGNDNSGLPKPPKSRSRKAQPTEANGTIRRRA